MRIALVTTIFPCLSQTFVLNQITGLLDLGHDVHIFALSAQNEKCHPDVIKYNLLGRTTYLKNFPIPKGKRISKAFRWIAQNACYHPRSIINGLNPLGGWKSAIDLTRLFYTISFLDKGPYDIVHCHFGGMGRLLSAIISSIPHKVFVTSFYGYDVTRRSQISTGVYKRLIKRGDFFLPLSRTMENKLIKLGFPEERIICHQIGIQPSKFEFFERIHSNGRPIHLLTIARLVEKKGVEYGLKAIAKILQGNGVEIRYRIAGDGPLREELEILTWRLGISKYVEFLGWKEQSEMVKLFQTSDIFMLPSITASDGDQEGTPVALMEAQAMGLPVLSTLHSGIPEIVRHGKSGYLVPERNAEALAERLEHLITHPQEWPLLGQEGRRIIMAHHDVSKLNRLLVEIYQRWEH